MGHVYEAGREQGGGQHVSWASSGSLQLQEDSPLRMSPHTPARVLSGAALISEPPPLASSALNQEHLTPRRGSDYRKRETPASLMLQNAKWRKPRNLKGIWAAPQPSGPFSSGISHRDGSIRSVSCCVKTAAQHMPAPFTVYIVPAVLFSDWSVFSFPLKDMK